MPTIAPPSPIRVRAYCSHDPRRAAQVAHAIAGAKDRDRAIDLLELVDRARAEAGVLGPIVEVIVADAAIAELGSALGHGGRQNDNAGRQRS
jgi:hypothetical protein